MGCCLSCCRGYKKIPENDNESNRRNSFSGQRVQFSSDSANAEMTRNLSEKAASNITSSSSGQPRASARDNSFEDFDYSSKVFRGTQVYLKFTSKSEYEKKYLWISLQTNTLHMSQYMTKERRHKEANLIDVVSVLRGPPIKFRQGLHLSDSNIDDNFLRNMCLTINFKKGGGVDVMFTSMADRDEWFDTVSKLMENYANNSFSKPKQDVGTKNHSPSVDPDVNSQNIQRKSVDRGSSNQI